MAIAAAATFIITMYYALNIFNSKVANVAEREELYSKLSEIDKVVRNNYLGDIDEEVLMDSVAEGYMDGLGDTYSIYMTQEVSSFLKSSRIFFSLLETWTWVIPSIFAVSVCVLFS